MVPAVVVGELSFIKIAPSEGERRNGAFFVERGVQNLLFALGLASLV